MFIETVGGAEVSVGGARDAPCPPNFRGQIQGASLINTTPALNVLMENVGCVDFCIHKKKSG